jgi:hypothetical protein
MADHQSANHDPAEDIQVIELTCEEGMAILNHQARGRLGMTGDEFLRRWKAGDIDDPDRNDVLMLVLMIPSRSGPLAVSAPQRRDGVRVHHAADAVNHSRLNCELSETTAGGEPPRSWRGAVLT